MRLVRTATLAALCLAASLPAPASQTPSLLPAETPRISRDVRISVRDVWTPTDIDVQPGERAVFTGAGTGICDGQTEFGPVGIPRGFRDLLRVLPMQAGRGALIGRIGEADVAQPFVIGTSAEVTETAGGMLFIGVNRADNDACTAGFSVHVEVFPPRDGGSAPVARRVDAIDGVDAALLARLPRRVRDREGNAGDMVNFLILGTEAAMQRVFKAAGWVTVDPDVPGALIAGVLGTLSKAAYVTLPMSQLYLLRPPAGCRVGPCRADQSRRVPPSPPPLARARRGGRHDALGGGRHARHRLRARSTQQRHHPQDRSGRRSRTRIRRGDADADGHRDRIHVHDTGRTR